MEVGASQSFQFFWQIIWFVGNDRALPKCSCQILHYLIRYYQIIKKSDKNQFYITHMNHLM